MRVLPLPENVFRSKVVRLIRRELDRAGFAEDAEGSYSLDVKIEKLALFTRGDEHLGYRQGYARLEFKLRSGEEDKLTITEEGEAKFPGSRVRRSRGGGFLGHLYVYEREDPKPLDYAVRFAVRAFLEDLAPHLP
ncbi:MAG: hypothetical protein O7H41_20430 [Planctomycetota bacterium]|nr:hypothetical protein [Planctomycetota bacterium]